PDKGSELLRAESETAHHYGEGPSRADEHRLAEFPTGFDLILGCPAQSQRPVGVCLEPGPVLFRNGVGRFEKVSPPPPLRLKDAEFFGLCPRGLLVVLRGLLIGARRIMFVAHLEISMSPAALPVPAGFLFALGVRLAGALDRAQFSGAALCAYGARIGHAA